MQTPSAVPPSPAAPPPPSGAPAPRVPKRFFIGMAALYVLMLGLFFALESPLYETMPSWPWLMPAMAGGSFLLVSTLFVIIIGRGRTSGLLLAACTILSLAFAVVAAVYSTNLAYDSSGRVGALEPALRPIRWFADRINDPEAPLAARLAVQLGTIPLEHALIMLPVFVLLALRVLRTPQAAMLAAALC